MIWMGLLYSLLVFGKGDPNPWAQVQKPIDRDSAQIYGSYTAGCLTNAETLDLTGQGYQVVNPYRNRYHGHPSLVRFLKNLGLWAESQKLGKIVVGDLAQPAGGPLTGAHRSHQIGLDADIRLHLLEPKKTIKNPNDFNSTDVVTCSADKKNIKYTFRADKWPIGSTQLLKKMATDDAVERVFVSAGIKRYLCESFPEHPEWLKKIRPEWGHTGHLHVRLKCPKGLIHCEGQSPVSNDATDSSKVGCGGNDFKSWFTASSDKAIRRDCLPKSTPEPIPYWEKVMSSTNFPKECQYLIKR